MNFYERTMFSLTLIVATQATRFLPLVFKANVDKYFSSKILREHLGDLIIFFLILYCYRDFSFDSEYILRLAVGLLVFAIQWFKGSALLSIFIGTAFYMLAKAQL